METKQRNISETPDRWVILSLPNNNFKVFGSWAGGYLGADSWRLNSGISKVEEDSDNYYFYGMSGSCYKCHKKGYGIMTSYSIGILYDMLDKSKGLISLLEESEIREKLEL